MAEQLPGRKLEPADLAGSARIHEARGAEPCEQRVGKAPLALGFPRELAGEPGDLLHDLLHGGRFFQLAGQRAGAYRSSAAALHEGIGPIAACLPA